MNLEKYTPAMEIARIEIDSAIATAKQYPRDEISIIKKIEKLCTMDDEIASEMFYVKPVGYSETKMKKSVAKTELSNTLNNPDYESKFAIGESVRFAEICIAMWGNIKVRTYLKQVEDKQIIVCAEAIDLECNTAVSCDVTRSIYGNNGRYSASTIMNTIQAAQSIAYRNIAFKLIPKALFKSVLTKIKKTSVGLKEKTETSKEVTFETAKNNAVKYFLKAGITEEQILKTLELSDLSEMNQDHIVILRGFKTSIAEKQETLESIFNPIPEFNNVSETAKLRTNED